MKALKNIGNSIKGAGCRVGAKVAKRSPEILMITGGVTFIATIVVACRQTLKCEDILDKHERSMDDIQACIEMAAEDPEKVQYSDQDAKRDKFIAYCHTGLGFAKVYAPAILLGVVSITCFGCSFRIMKKRNLALTAAYATLDSAFKGYRKRVVDELGEESDKYFRYGYKKYKNALVEKIDPETGEIKEVKEKVIDTVPWDEEEDGIKNRMINDGIFVFAPETSRRWGPDELHNDATIQSVRNVAQVNYDCKKHIFLNEILRELGMDEIPYGQLVGWCKGIGDDEIEFKINKVYRKASSDPNRNPLRLSYECVYELEFNTCGVMWDKI